MLSTTPSPPTVERRLLFADEIKHQLGYTQAKSVIRLVKEQGLPAHRVGRRYLFDPAEVESWLRSRSGQPEPPADPYRAAIKKLVDEAPPLTAEQAGKIRAVLGGAA